MNSKDASNAEAISQRISAKLKELESEYPEGKDTFLMTDFNEVDILTIAELKQLISYFEK